MLSKKPLSRKMEKPFAMPGRTSAAKLFSRLVVAKSGPNAGTMTAPVNSPDNNEIKAFHFSFHVGSHFSKIRNMTTVTATPLMIGHSGKRFKRRNPGTIVTSPGKAIVAMQNRSILYVQGSLNLLNA
jgi:hypothetical protein